MKLNHGNAYLCSTAIVCGLLLHVPSAEAFQINADRAQSAIQTNLPKAQSVLTVPATKSRNLKVRCRARACIVTTVIEEAVRYCLYEWDTCSHLFHLWKDGPDAPMDERNRDDANK
jgi:hypothetical protein